jgi:hypothetical protein
MFRPSIRAVVLVPLLSLGLLVPGFDANLTRADPLPTPCEEANIAKPAEAADDTLLMLRMMLPADADPALAAQPPRPNVPTPPNPGTPPPNPGTLPPPVLNAPGPPGPITAPKPPGTDLRVPDQAMLNLGPIVAVRQFRESLSDKQKADLQAVVTKHRGELQQVRSRLPEPAADPRGTRGVKAGQGDGLHQASTELDRIGDQVDTEIDAILTPSQRMLLQKANPKRLRAELPEAPADLTAGVAELQAGC